MVHVSSPSQARDWRASASTLGVLLGLFATTAGCAAASATTTAPAPAQGRGGIGTAYTVTVGPVVLPPTTACRSSRSLRVHLHHSDGERPVLVRLSVAGHRISPHDLHMHYGAFDLRIPPRGRYTVAVTVRLGRGRTARTITVHGSYHSCTTT